jgi:hypothetical protein
MLDLGINFGFEEDQFYMTFNSCSRDVKDVRTECEILCEKIYSQNKNIMLSLSSGLDSQVVLHSFISKKIPIKCAFLYMPGFNETEFNQIKILYTKYNKLDLKVIKLDPILLKEELLSEYETTGIPPYQLLHKKFLSMLPSEYDFIQGLDGPDFIKKDSEWYVIHTANSFINSRVRGLDLIEREGRIISWEKSPEIYLSILDDDITSYFMIAYNNISKNGLSYSNDKAIPIIDHYDLYIKPYLYAKYWKDELKYFPKYQGPENVQWIMNKVWHEYKKNLITVKYDVLVDHLKSKNGTTLKLYQQLDNQQTFMIKK